MVFTSFQDINYSSHHHQRNITEFYIYALYCLQTIKSDFDLTSLGNL